MSKLMDQLRDAIAADPNPKPRRKTQGGGLSSEIRRNRVRIGLPEIPTEQERAAWEAAKSKNPDIVSSDAGACDSQTDKRESGPRRRGSRIAQEPRR